MKVVMMTKQQNFHMWLYTRLLHVHVMAHILPHVIVFWILFSVVCASLIVLWIFALPASYQDSRENKYLMQSADNQMGSKLVRDGHRHFGAINLEFATLLLLC